MALECPMVPLGSVCPDQWTLRVSEQHLDVRLTFPALLSAAAAPSRRVRSAEVRSPDECHKGHRRVYNSQKQGTGPSVWCSLTCGALPRSLFYRSYSAQEACHFYVFLAVIWNYKQVDCRTQQFMDMCGEGFFSSCFQQPAKVILKHGQELEEEQDQLAEHQPLEQEDLNFERWKRRPIPRRTLHQKIADLKKYLWNAETNEFMGRSGKSWSEFMTQETFCAVGVLRGTFGLIQVLWCFLMHESSNKLLLLILYGWLVLNKGNIECFKRSQG